MKTKFFALGLTVAFSVIYSTQIARAHSLSPGHWGDGHTLSSGTFGTVTNGSQVGVWQSVLAVNALLPSKCYVDGVYGSTTGSGTNSFRAARGLGSSTSVNQATWMKANESAFFVADGYEPGYSVYELRGTEGRRFYLLLNVSAGGTPTFQPWAFRAYGTDPNTGGYYYTSRVSYYATEHTANDFQRPC